MRSEIRVQQLHITSQAIFLVLLKGEKKWHRKRLWEKRNLALFLKLEEKTAWLYIKKDNSGDKGGIEKKHQENYGSKTLCCEKAGGMQWTSGRFIFDKNASCSFW